jgi:hypothetical protein
MLSPTPPELQPTLELVGLGIRAASSAAGIAATNRLGLVELNQCTRHLISNDGRCQSGNPSNSLCGRRTRTPLKLGPRQAGGSFGPNFLFTTRPRAAMTMMRK